MTNEGKGASALSRKQPRGQTPDGQVCNSYKEEANRYRRLSLGVIPLKARSKEPALLELKPYLSKHVTDEELSSWDWAGVGIVTGSSSGVIVLDVDGPEGEEELKRRGWTHSATATAKTGKGQHIYFKHPGGQVPTRVRLAPGLDLKADGGYVVAPPSVHPNGETYQWIIPPEEGFAECPDWLLEAVGERSTRPSVGPLDEPIAEGSRNTTLTSLAGSMRARGLSEGVISEALNVVNASQCKPPLPEKEVDSIAKSVASYPTPGMQWQTLSSASPPSALVFTKLGKMMEEGVEPPEELIPGLLYKEGIHSLYGQAGHGKTIAALWASLQTMKQGLPVIYLDEENGCRRVVELLGGFGADPEELDVLFHYAHAPGLSLGADSLQMWEAVVEEKRPALAVFDSFADMLALAGLEENNSVDVTSWIKAFCEPIKFGGGAVLILDHVAKSQGGALFARGSGAKLAKMDVAWGLQRNQVFDRERIGKITLSCDKDRNGSMPDKREILIGGDGAGKLVFSPSDTEEDEENSGNTLSANAQRALEVLEERFANGAKSGEWKSATNMTDSTFYRALDQLKDEYVCKEGNLYVLSPGISL